MNFIADGFEKQMPPGETLFPLNNESKNFVLTKMGEKKNQGEIIGVFF